MGTETIELDEEAYERLRAEKRADESFSDVVRRLTADVHADWRRGFGKYGGEEGEFLQRITERRGATVVTGDEDDVETPGESTEEH